MDATATLDRALAEAGPADQPQDRTPGRRIRNYQAMGDSKLVRVAREFATCGEAWHRCRNTGSGDPARDMQTIADELRSRGLEL